VARALHLTPNFRSQPQMHFPLQPTTKIYNTMAPKKPAARTTPRPKVGPTPLPNWPTLKPLLPITDLALSLLIPNQIILVHNFFTSTLCKNYVTFLKGLPLTTTPGKPKKGEASRFNDRFQVIDEVFAERLWVETGLRELVCDSGQLEHWEEGESMEKMSEDERRNLWYFCHESRLVYMRANAR
jgi:hypothetical protein